MRVLVVEDDHHKLAAIDDFLRSSFPALNVTKAKSYQTGLVQALDAGPDLILLDMTLPTWDVSVAESGGRTRPYAGREILFELEEAESPARVIVVTQFESFGEAADRLTLAALSDELYREFPQRYLGHVFYQPSNSDWKRRLAKHIQRFTGGKQ